MIDLSEEAVAALCGQLRAVGYTDAPWRHRCADTLEALAHSLDEHQHWLKNAEAEAKENRINAGALDMAKAELDRQLTENLELVADLDAERAKVERLRVSINGALNDLGDGLEDEAYRRLKAILSAVIAQEQSK